MLVYKADTPKGIAAHKCSCYCHRVNNVTAVNGFRLKLETITILSNTDKNNQKWGQYEKKNHP